MTNARYETTKLLAEIAFGSLEESDAAIERAGRRARWERRKAVR